MKKLTFIRHGAASAPAAKKTDFERPLSALGVREANNIAQQLKLQHFNFDQMFCSTAQRALTTAQIIYATLQANGPLLAEQALYNVDLNPLYRFIEMIDDNIQHAVIVGHNPGLSYLANDLQRESINGMSTCTTIQLQLNINNWLDIQSHCGQLVRIDSPSCA